VSELSPLTRIGVDGHPVTRSARNFKATSEAWTVYEDARNPGDKIIGLRTR
jgi:hypothetical protein